MSDPNPTLAIRSTGFNRSISMLILCAGTMVPRMHAQHATEPDPETPIVNLHEMWVVTESGVSSFTEYQLAENAFAKNLSLTEQLSDLPGFAIIERGNGAAEPVIRGLSWERVATTYNGMRLPNASPTRTHSPLQRFPSTSIEQVSLSTAIPSLSLGPPVSGGWIALETDTVEEENNLLKQAIWVDYEPDRNGISSSLMTRSPNQFTNFGYRAALSQHQLGNYQSGEGRRVPSHQEDWGTALNAWFSNAAEWNHRADFHYQHQGLNENASLPLDTIDGDFHAFTMNHLYTGRSPEVSSLRLRYGFSQNEVTLSNQHRGALPMLVENRASTKTYHADLQWLYQTTSDMQLRIGVDHNQETKLAIRQRGTVGRDSIWPDTRYQQAGAFSEFFVRTGPNAMFRLGARLDLYKTEARMADQSAFGHEIQTLYLRYTPEVSAAQSQQSDQKFSANILYQSTPTPEFAFYTGLSSTAQLPGATERYRAFLNALGGGFEIGNPALLPERKWEWASGVNVHRSNYYLKVETFLSRVENYQWREWVGTTQGVLNLPKPQPVFSYRNVDVELMGLEFSGSLRLWDGWQLPFSAEWVHAELRSNGPGYQRGERLPELPAATASLTLVKTWNPGEALKFRFDLEGRWTRSQKNPLPLINPIYADSEAYTLANVGITASYRERLQVALWIHNLLDKTYEPYLMPSADGLTAPGSDLVAGERIPGAGRTVVASMRFSF